MKKQTNITVLSLLIILSFVISCNKKEASSSVATGGGNTPLTSAQVIGTSSVCRSGGSTFSNLDSGVFSYLETIDLNADETYRYEQYWFSGSVCQLGGTSQFRYTQEGTFDMGAITTSPVGATQILFTVTSSYLQTFGSTTDSVASYWETRFNTGAVCGANFTFNPAGGTDYSPGGATCASAGDNWSLPMFPNNTNNIHNVVVLDTAAQTLTVSENTILWYPGSAGGSYPTTATKVFTNFQ